MGQYESETLEEFRKSFYYGSRPDLNFKFLGRPEMSAQETGEFFHGLLAELMEAFDTSQFDKLMQYCFRWQVYGFEPKSNTPAKYQPAFRYDTTPWAPLTKALSQCRVALVTTGGFFVEGEDPLGPNGPAQEDVIPLSHEYTRMAPVLSVIPRDTPPEMIRVRDPGYDITAALRDYNVVAPFDRLKELEAEGFIGELAEESYSFLGVSSQKRLLVGLAPELAERVKKKGVDVVLLVGA